MKKVLVLVATVIVSAFGFYYCGDGGSEVTCETLVCQNGGDCVDGKCVCPEHFEGETCEIQSTPLFIRITKISVNSQWSAYKPSGQRWDNNENPPADRPDLSVEIMYKGTSQIYQYHHYVKDAYYDTPADFIPANGLAPEITTDNLETSYRVNLIDIDDIDYEVMGGADFVIYDKKGGFPTEITARDDNSALEFTLKLHYQF